MKAVGTIVPIVMALGCASAAARGGGLTTWICLDRPGLGALVSDAPACGKANPYESAASATERIDAALLKRYPDEATLEAMRKNVLEQVRVKAPAEEQEAVAARVNRLFDAQLKRMRPLWQQPANP